MKKTVLVCDSCGQVNFLNGDWYEVVVQRRVGANGKIGIPAHYEICDLCYGEGNPIGDWPNSVKLNANAILAVERKDR